jgi:hypothetical protein
MSADPIGQFNRSECQAEFTYTMSRKFIKIQDTGKGSKPVAEDLEAVFAQDRSLASRLNCRVGFPCHSRASRARRSVFAARSSSPLHTSAADIL